MSARLLTLRRMPIKAANPDDNVIVESVSLRCTRCDARWSASLRASVDGIAASDAHCPRCAPTPPEAA